jgi:predicted nucleotidyltransferase
MDSVLAARRREILALAAGHGAKNVQVFGSRARGTAGPESDVDFLVELEPHRSLLDIIGLKQDLEDLLHCKVDVVTKAAVSPYFRETVLEEATDL